MWRGTTASILLMVSGNNRAVFLYGYAKFYDITEIKQSVGRAGALRDASTASIAGRATPYLIKHAGGATDMFTITKKQRLVKDQKGIYTSGVQTEKTPMQIAYENAQKSARTGDKSDRELLLDASDASLI